MSSSRRIDPEVRAMSVIAAELDRLDHEQRGRVLDWARHRYVDGPKAEILEVFRAWTDIIAEKARSIGVEPGELESAVLVLVDEIEAQRVKAEPSGRPIRDEPQA